MLIRCLAFLPNFVAQVPLLLLSLTKRPLFVFMILHWILETAVSHFLSPITKYFDVRNFYVASHLCKSWNCNIYSYSVNGVLLESFHTHSSSTQWTLALHLNCNLLTISFLPPLCWMIWQLLDIIRGPLSVLVSETNVFSGVPTIG